MVRKFVIPALVVIASIFGAVTLLATSPQLEPSNIEPIANGNSSGCSGPARSSASNAAGHSSNGKSISPPIPRNSTVRGRGWKWSSFHLM